MKRPVQSYKLERSFPLPRWKVWDLLADTDYLNQMIGLSPISFSEPRSLQNAPVSREVKSNIGGIFKMSWNELPFEWEKNRYYSVEREYANGPLKRFYGGVILEDDHVVLDSGEWATKVQLFADFTPAYLHGKLGISLIGKSSLKKTMIYLEDYLKLAQAGQPGDVPKPSPKSYVNQSVLSERMAGLKNLNFSKKLVDQLQNFIVSVSDEEILRMRPYELADKWDANRDEVLRLFLYATKRGVFNLSWELMCPNCRVSKKRAESLAEINPVFHCDLCGINYEANLDRYVELHFSVVPLIRDVHRSVYCIGGPVNTPHVLIQKRIDPGKKVDLPFPKTKSELRIRILGKNDILGTRKDQSICNPIQYTDKGWAVSSFLRPQAGETVTIENVSHSCIVMVLEKVEWDELAVTAAKVTAMQEFRDLFSSEVLAPGQQIKIENITVLFSDLKDSTALYEEVGDAHAYSHVRRHFDYMKKWVSANSGSIVKTMGDAVMAVFHRPEDAIKTAFSVYEKLETFNAELPKSERISMKVGIHTGPAIVVNSNDKLDYFGRTINLASRIQGKSNGDAFMVSEELFNNESVSSYIEERLASVEFLQAHLKGIDETARLVQISL